VRLGGGWAMSLGPSAMLTSVRGGVEGTGTTAKPTTEIGDNAAMGAAAGTSGTVLSVPTSVPKALGTAAGVLILESQS
jgi:hypothetical protein